jgi:hypothetical protein
VYNPDDWADNGYEKITFTPVGENADLIVIDENGNITAKETTETKDVTVRVQSKDGFKATA